MLSGTFVFLTGNSVCLYWTPHTARIVIIYLQSKIEEVKMFAMLVRQEWFMCSGPISPCIFRSQYNNYCFGQVCIYVGLNVRGNGLYAYGPVKFGDDLYCFTTRR